MHYCSQSCGVERWYLRYASCLLLPIEYVGLKKIYACPDACADAGSDQRPASPGYSVASTQPGPPPQTPSPFEGSEEAVTASDADTASQPAKRHDAAEPPADGQPKTPLPQTPSLESRKPRAGSKTPQSAAAASPSQDRPKQVSSVVRGPGRHVTVNSAPLCTVGLFVALGACSAAANAISQRAHCPQLLSVLRLAIPGCGSFPGCPTHVHHASVMHAAGVQHPSLARPGGAALPADASVRAGALHTQPPACAKASSRAAASPNGGGAAAGSGGGGRAHGAAGAARCAARTRAVRSRCSMHVFLQSATAQQSCRRCCRVLGVLMTRSQLVTACQHSA